MYIIKPSAPPTKNVDEPESPRTPSPTLGDASEGEGKEAREQIGMARMCTDYVTFAYLTDVYLLPEWRKDGLGKWMVACVKEVIDGIPELRRAMLLTSTGVGQEFYKRELGWWDVVEERQEGLGCMTLKGWGFGDGS